MSRLYKEVVQAKNSLEVPIFASGKAAHSKYAPQREAENFAPEKNGEIFFAVVLGAAGGFHLQSLLRRNPGCKILAIEKSQEDLDFLKENVPLIKKLFEDKRIVFCAADQEGAAESALSQNYFPAHYGNLEILTLRSWSQEAGQDFETIIKRIKALLPSISADYSTQARFGRLWSKNIFCNLRVLKKIQEKKQEAFCVSQSDLQKTAAVIAAGPSLDQTADLIKQERNKYFVIATDTALKSFARRKIKVDAVVSIDAQFLSAEHFYACDCKGMIFVLDLGADSSIANYALNNNGKLIFANSGHPLISFASAFCKNPFPRLQSGGGTVAISAVDFALQCGFKNVKIFGADFGYSRGKAYAKGSYLDDLYQCKQSRIDSAESAWTRLMFRSQLKKNERSILQSPVLLRYQETMESFLGDFKRNNFIYDIKNQGRKSESLFLKSHFDFTAFKSRLDSICRLLENSEEFLPEESLILPDMAYWRTQADRDSVFCGQNKIQIKDAKKLALKKILLYNAML